MKAAVIYENGDPDVLSYEDVPDPDCPDGCVVIDVEAISIEGGDLLPRASSLPPVPHIVGYLAAAMATGRVAGVEVTIYNPAPDPAGSAGAALTGALARGLGGGAPPPSTVTA
ncbi:MAG: hypothetical protein ACRDMH_12190 [Solirubrobacterales bacterium]